ncbi:MAG: hypothetical protein JKY03_10485, partial [Aureispira sp.]|nr:hypothetical protein [Aureispira sp.]
MDCNTIKEILDKYWEGETSLKEEKLLRTYFNSNQVAKELESFRPLFVYYKEQKRKTTTQSFEGLKNKSVVHRLLPTWVAVAASILMLLMAGTFCYVNQTVPNPTILAVDETIKDTYKDPEVAYKEAK